MERSPIPGILLVRHLGTGASGQVWQARYAGEKDKTYALKIFNSTAIAREILQQTLTRISQHQQNGELGFVPIVDFDFSVNTPYCLTELMLDDSGEPATLADAAADFSSEQAWDAIDQIADILANAHRIGVSHCALHPRNIFCQKGANGELKIRISDFAQGILPGIYQTPYHTSAVAFMPPRQLDNLRDYARGAGANWDVYAFGALAYWLLNGRRHARARENIFHFENGNNDFFHRGAPPAKQVLEAVAADAEKAPRWYVSFDGELDQRKAEMLLKCLELDGERSFFDMREAQESLRRLSFQKKITAMGEQHQQQIAELQSQLNRAKFLLRRTIASSVIAVLLLVAALVFFIIW